MASYVVSDIHGELELFEELLGKIALKDSDTLYILGDVVDRGPHPVKVLQKLMSMPNAVCLAGNHELMALECLDFLCTDITEETADSVDGRMIRNLAGWQVNGSASTIKEFRRLSPEERHELMEYMRDFLIYEEVSAGGQDWLLVHSGPANFSPEKDIEDYSLKELVWDRADLGKKCWDGVLVVNGHTPTQSIEENPRPGYIYRVNGHVMIDCGACFPGGRLAALCLDTGEEFYSSENPGPQADM